jgi:hypothetical protein
MNRHLFLAISIILLVTACTNTSRTYSNTKTEPLGVNMPGSGDIYYNSLFGEKYLVQGGFLNHSKDSIETNLWTYTRLKSPFVFFGNYSRGLQKGDWNFVMSDGTQLSSQWNVYDNGVTPCAFSLPFQYETQYIDSFSLKLRTMNDSLGKIGIMLQIRDTALNEEDLRKFGRRADSELHEQGFRFTNSNREIKKGNNYYFFYEYSLRDSLNRESKAYYFYGNVPSNKHFVLFTFCHLGPKEDLVQTICSMIATSLYVENERFYNPYNSVKNR